MATIQDKNRKTSERENSSGNLDNNADSRPADSAPGGNTCGHDGNLTGRYQGGEIHSDRGPWAGKAAGRYEKGKVYDMDGHWGGKEAGRQSENVLDECNGCERYRPSSESCSPTPPDVDRPSAPCPPQVSGSVACAEKEASRTMVRPQTRQGRGIPFLMSTCRHCGAPARGRFYTLLLILTPFALLFYALICSMVIYIAFTNGNNYHVLANLIASVITIMIFLAPGLVVLYVLRRPKGVCDACSQRLYYQSLEANQRPGEMF